MVERFRNLISKKIALIGFLAISFFALVYHFLIIAQIVDYKNAWGGQLTSLDQMYQFETVSVILQIILSGIVFLSTEIDSSNKLKLMFKILLFAITFLFFLNTIGNIFAIQLFEKIVFTPLTFLAGIFALRLALD
jgi:hypothetical protein